MPLNLRTQHALEQYQLRKKIFVKQVFLYKLLGIHTPTYALEKLNINFELSKYSKLIILLAYYRMNFYKIIEH